MGKKGEDFFECFFKKKNPIKTGCLHQDTQKKFDVLFEEFSGAP